MTEAELNGWWYTGKENKSYYVKITEIHPMINPQLSIVIVNDGSIGITLAAFLSKYRPVSNADVLKNLQ